jgi:hypothetical protein
METNDIPNWLNYLLTFVRRLAGGFRDRGPAPLEVSILRRIAETSNDAVRESIEVQLAETNFVERRVRNDENGKISESFLNRIDRGLVTLETTRPLENRSEHILGRLQVIRNGTTHKVTVTATEGRLGIIEVDPALPLPSYESTEGFLFPD